MSTTTSCTCCRGRRCVRVRTLGEIKLDAAFRRLRDKLIREQQQQQQAALAAPASELRVASPDPDAPPTPWQMTRVEFDAAAEPAVETAWGTPRFHGLSCSVLQREVHFLLRCLGGPDDGYRVRVPGRRADLYDQPHRAFVEAALAEGLAVPSSVLAEYPELRYGRVPVSAPRLDT